jgi:hypothetical protein
LGGDLGSLAEVLLNVSAMVGSHHGIAEIDLDPL